LYIISLKILMKFKGTTMLLAFDIGNTNIDVGVFNKSVLLQHWRIDSQTNKTLDEWYVLLYVLFTSAKLSLKEITGVAVSSVVPGITDSICKFTKKTFSIESFLITSNSDLGITIRYNEPTAVGADRLCNAVAGVALFEGPLIIIDFGTATTYDIVSAHREYLGGIIAPGLETATRILHQCAAKLPSVELSFPNSVVGTNTEQSIQAGILYGAVASVEGLVKRINEELGYKSTVIGTGGLALLIGERTTVINHYIPELTLIGIEKIYHRTYPE